ncbi:MAG: hypothetical protein AAFR28_16905 [Pseudomonadota bacterium]
MTIDLNEAAVDTGDLIPDRTIAKVRLKIRPGGYDAPQFGAPGGIATHSAATGSVYLDCEATIIGGPYDRRKVWFMIGLFSSKGDNKWGAMGKTLARSILESARSIRPDDMSPDAVQRRRITSFHDLQDAEFVALISVEKGRDGGEDRNRINRAITPDHKAYAAAMNSTMDGGANVANGAATPSATATTTLSAQWT